MRHMTEQYLIKLLFNSCTDMCLMKILHIGEYLWVKKMVHINVEYTYTEHKLTFKFPNGLTISIS